MPLISKTTEHCNGVPVAVEEYETTSRAEFIAAVGDVVRFGSGGFRIVTASNPSSCRHVSLTGQTKSVTVRKGFDDERTFQATSYGSEETCAQRLPREFLAKRLGAEGLTTYQQARTDGVVADWITTQLGSVVEETNEMKSKTTTKSEPRGGLAADAKHIAAENAAKTGGKRSTKKAASTGTPKEPKKKAHNRSRVLRWCGAAGLTVDEAKKLTAHLKLGEITNGWYEVGMAEGKAKQGPLPVFTYGEEQRWKEIAAAKD